MKSTEMNYVEHLYKIYDERTTKQQNLASLKEEIARKYVSLII